MEEYFAQRAVIMALPETELEAQLKQAVQHLAKASQSVTDEDLALTVETRWGPWTLERLIGLPY